MKDKKSLKTIDGNSAAAHIAYGFSEVSAIYPITPSSSMGEIMDLWANQGKKNIFDSVVDIVQMQSEAGAAGALHGALAAGVFASTFTASQGLLLMIPDMYKIAGELLPCVFHVSARALATQALSIFGDHQDVMAARSTNFCMLCSNSVQEAMDLALVSHLSTLKSSLPFLHFFDGFRTSHEIQKIEMISYEQILSLIDEKDIQNHRKQALNPTHPHLRGSAQNPDIYFQITESANKYYDNVADIVQEQMKIVSNLTNRKYDLFDYVGNDDATSIIVMMGSGSETAQEVVDYLNKKDKKVGLLKVRLFRPFSIKHFIEKIPKTVQRIAVLDRTKENGAISEPLCMDVKTAFYNQKNKPIIIGGRYGLGGKDFTPSMVGAVFDNLNSDSPRDNFTIGIDDDVTNLSLKINEQIFTGNEDEIACMFWGLGGDGTVGANKDAIKIIGDNSDKYVQGYFEFDSKKSGGLTISHLRFSKSEIKSTYLLTSADYIAVSQNSYIFKYDILDGIKENGIFLLNTPYDLDDLERYLPNSIKRKIAQKNIQFYTVHASKLAKDLLLGKHINIIMQTSFFKLTNVLEFEKAKELLKNKIQITYSKKGQNIIDANLKAVDETCKYLEKISYPSSWNNLDNEQQQLDKTKPKFIQDIADIINAKKGDLIPVSKFTPGGKFPLATTKYEKRAISDFVASWDMEKCIQCNQCSLVCPHSAIRPFMIDEKDSKNAPDGYVGLKPLERKLDNCLFSIGISPADCVGCEKCIKTCPKAALSMKSYEESKKEQEVWDFLIDAKQVQSSLNKFTIKGSQFQKPLLEFSGACGGCTQTIYLKLLTQLFGKQMIIANATGCSSIWGGSAPSIPWTTDNGFGPAWANSLFEDNAEFGLGIYLAYKHRREELKHLIEKTIDDPSTKSDLKDALSVWVENFHDIEKSSSIENYENIINLLKNNTANDLLKKIFKSSDLLIKPSVWLVGGDGWAYDIDFGGIDHVLSLDHDINLFVLDTEVYSNTGGQASKATPIGAIAKFASLGKKTSKKDLGLIAIALGNVYVASISIDAQPMQAIKAIKEAKNYNGPSLIIAFCSCITHGIKGGLKNSSQNAKKALESGYWINYRYDPRKENPLTIDSKPPTSEIDELIESQNRFASLVKIDKEKATNLHADLKRKTKEKYDFLKKLEGK
jgi:pyruvate-ferredoxin/flavodoxin oxidoreductase